MTYDQTSGAVQWYEKLKVEEIFLGKSIVAAERLSSGEGQLTLSDGARVRLVPNEGASCCSSGAYELKKLTACANVITRAQIEVEAYNGPKPGAKGKRGKKGVASPYEDGHVYRLFVFTGQTKINVAHVEGDDGNGMYGSGFELFVRPA